MDIKNCEICGKEIDLSKYKRPIIVHICSKSCSNKKYRLNHKEELKKEGHRQYLKRKAKDYYGKEFYCRTCKKEYEPYRINQKYCSYECNRKDYQIKNQEELKLKKKQYYEIKGRKLRGVTIRLSPEYFKKVSGKNRYNWKERVIKQCLNCNNKFEVLKDGWNNNFKFCSLKCYHQHAIESNHWKWIKNRSKLVRRKGKEFSYLQKKEIIKRDKMICQICGIQTVFDGNISKQSCHIDHIIPISMNGTNKTSNGRVLCKKCNQSRAKHILVKEENMIMEIADIKVKRY